MIPVAEVSGPVGEQQGTVSSQWAAGAQRFGLGVADTARPRDLHDGRSRWAGGLDISLEVPRASWPRRFVAAAN